MKILKTNNVVIKGNCTDFTQDTYIVALCESNMLVSVSDNDFGEEVSVTISPEDALKIANEILNYYKGGIN